MVQGNVHEMDKGRDKKKRWSKKKEGGKLYTAYEGFMSRRP